jgi:hypothetical protein
MTYKQHLEALKALPPAEQLLRIEALCAKSPRASWPYGMPASIDPKLVLVGVSPGNSPGRGAGKDWISRPTIEKDRKRSHFYYPDSANYWRKLRYLADAFFCREGTDLSENDAVSLCTHFNLGTGSAGQASKKNVERDIIEWVSRLLNADHNPDLVVMFGLAEIFRGGSLEVVELPRRSDCQLEDPKQNEAVRGISKEKVLLPGMDGKE